jgi:hypothetical protein
LIARVRHTHPEIEIEEIEVLTHLSRALQDGVLMLPTLVVGERRYHHAPPIDELLAPDMANQNKAPQTNG